MFSLQVALEVEGIRFLSIRVTLLRLFICCYILLAISRESQQASNSRTFAIDFENDGFLKDGEPFRLISGSFHYFRVPRIYWRDRLRKMRAAGLNTVATYVEWGLHEPVPDFINFFGDLDLMDFIQIAEQEGLLVNLRVGPYICAERDMGGLPPWLLSVKPNMNLRSSDPTYKMYVKKWLDILMPKVEPLLYGNGGPIILVQVENEYGSYRSYPACDMPYLLWLRDEFRKHVKTAAVLYTTDGAGQNYLRCGKIPGVYATVDFGSGSTVNTAFQWQRNVEPNGPLVNSEYYPGWLTHWGESVQTVSGNNVANKLREILLLNASVNIYVFMGGTNFGFTAGANFGKKYEPQLTSYDYDAPLTEAGDPTEKYFQIRDVIGEFVTLPAMPLPQPSPKASIGPILLRKVSSLQSLASGRVNSEYPRSFEELRNFYGFVLYETIIPADFSNDPYRAYNLSAPSIKDRGIVFIDKERTGVFCRASRKTWIPVGATPGQKLSILVENQGRINYGQFLNDSKGLGNVTLDGQMLIGWTMTGYPLNNATRMQQVVLQKLARQMRQNIPEEEESEAPAVYYSRFVLPKPENSSTNRLPLDTFLDTTGWGKGVVFLNGFNLGRYWPNSGPQVTLYVPGYLFKPYPARNHLVMVEIDDAPEIAALNFVDTPIFSQPNTNIC